MGGFYNLRGPLVFPPLTILRRRQNPANRVTCHCADSCSWRLHRRCSRHIGTSGAALLEVHDLDPSSGSLITNMSTRGVVETNASVMIGGFIVGAGLGTNGDGSSEVLIRALGPELTGFGISDALQDPTMELHDGNGNLLLANDNWKDSQQAAIQATGLAPGDNREPAILTTLIQGNWTAIVRGKNNTTDVGLIELYRIH